MKNCPLRLSSWLILLAFFAPPAWAQSPECGTTFISPMSGSVSTGQPVKARFCVPDTDTIEAAVIYTNGSPTNLGPVTRISTPNPNGLVQVEVFIGNFQKGSWTLTMSVYNHAADTGALQESAQSSPFGLLVVDLVLPPATPTKFYILRR